MTPEPRPDLAAALATAYADYRRQVSTDLFEFIAAHPALAPWRAAIEALADLIDWIDDEVEQPRPDPHPAMRVQANIARAALAEPRP